MNTTLRPALRIDRLSTVNDGSKLLISATIDGLGYDLITVVADETDESLWMELVVNGKPVQIPLSMVRSVIEDAPDDVHSERWFLENAYSAEEASQLTPAGRAFAKRKDRKD